MQTLHCFAQKMLSKNSIGRQTKGTNDGIFTLRHGSKRHHAQYLRSGVRDQPNVPKWVCVVRTTIFQWTKFIVCMGPFHKYLAQGGHDRPDKTDDYSYHWDFQYVGGG